MTDKSVLQWLDVWNGAKGNDSGWIDLGTNQFHNCFPRSETRTYVRVRPEVVCLDVVKVGGRSEGIILPIQPTHPAGD